MTTQTTDNITPSAGGFATGYAGRESGRDEMVEPDGSLRPHWRMFVNLLDDLGPEEIPRRWEQARRLIRENGITHNVYGDPKGLDRPWNLDLVPLLVTAGEWREVSEALVQRATLLDMLMADLYGPARCVTEGLLPPELLYSNPGFLRACHGVAPPRGQWLHLYAADLVRATDGRFRVLSDRTQAPSGAGYSLENRIVLSGVLPAVFRQCNVQRLAPFFIALRQTLVSLAPASRENPRVVLLTPGPYNETYFEHAYLARYLGYTLVQGNDLTVREGRVYLKTLGGLQRVDVILRRVDDDYCDPLELYQHSFLGVPGLVEAVREGNVAVANALGTGVLQTPAFLCFLPEICRRLLGEELKLPSVQTWWCGEADSRRYVLENLSRLVIKPAFPTPGSDPEFGEEMSSGQLEQLAARIAARPEGFVAQEHIESHTAPVLLNDHMEARRFVVRAYLAADGTSYTAMPGGLTRVTAATDSLVVSLQKGGGSKDTWVLADGPVGHSTLLTTATQPVELSRGGGDLPSRIADDLFWLGRYVQRAEADVRVARSLFTRLVDNVRADSPGTVNALATTLLGRHRLRLDEGAASTMVQEVFNPAGYASLRSSIGHVQGLVRALRDRVSADAWRILQGIERDLSDFDSNIQDDPVVGVVQLLNRLTIGFLAFDGVLAESMTRGQAWRFLDIGSRIERAIAIARLVRSTLVKVVPDEPALLDAALEIADSSLTYRRRYLTQLEAPAVVDLLVADETNPRAVAFQIAAIEQHLSNLPREASHPQRSPHRQTILELRTRLRLADLRAACQISPAKTRPELESLMNEIIDRLESVTERVSQIYFSHAEVSRSLAGPGEEGIK
ncbi:MAG: hypothetical protein JWO87_2512 [Phycisphaerales bacterium]|nr:hypothetical protein [Phycisphaerales bacterium]MDB5300849.1 hypothetical protein [Phycisphaerales bacterium]